MQNAATSETAVVRVSNGNLLAENCVWDNISYNREEGQLLAINDGASLELNGCRFANGYHNATNNDSPRIIPILINNGSTAHLSDSVLVRMKVMGGSLAIVRNASFSSMWASERMAAPLLQFINSFGALYNTIFMSISATGADQNDNTKGVVIDVDSSMVNITNCMFDQTSWFDPNVSSTICTTESQIVGVREGSLLHVANTTFNAVGGCGTAIRATGTSTLEMMGVNITNIDLSRLAPNAAFATVIVMNNSSLHARDSLWSSINAGNTTNPAAILGINTTNVTLNDCNFKDITSLGPSPAVQWRNPKGGVDIVRCTWENINTNAALSFLNAPDGCLVKVSDTHFQGCSSRDRGTLSLGNDDGRQVPVHDGHQVPVQLSNLTFTNNTGQKYAAALQVLNSSVSINGRYAPVLKPSRIAGRLCIEASCKCAFPYGFIGVGYLALILVGK
ncbi:hypothetical protein Vretifemale_16038 [Volvox reticuliferus]|uniref:Uncharacterized protein n=1 Tax=Volvox reticuliferus TaxID=1737510 RepID=A0A8J4CQM6_9CHLO|nr:hypothetical protein Vretifemale_16038 [Volvox reticuliferus]